MYEAYAEYLASLRLKFRNLELSETFSDSFFMVSMCFGSLPSILCSIFLLSVGILRTVSSLCTISFSEISTSFKAYLCSSL